MEITSIIIKNFMNIREIYAKNLPYGFIWIVGDSASGKSNLLKAIEYCVFGLDEKISLNRMNSLVQITFMDNRNKYIIERIRWYGFNETLTFSKNGIFDIRNDLSTLFPIKKQHYKTGTVIKVSNIILIDSLTDIGIIDIFKDYNAQIFVTYQDITNTSHFEHVLKIKKGVNGSYGFFHQRDRRNI